MQKLLLTCFSILFYCFPLQAEYRAFQLQIKSKTGEVKRTFASTLDPEQYKGYFPVQNDENVTYTDTWMCRGRTGSFQKICNNPKATQKTSF